MSFQHTMFTWNNDGIEPDYQSNTKMAIFHDDRINVNIYY